MIGDIRFLVIKMLDRFIGGFDGSGDGRDEDR